MPSNLGWVDYVLQGPQAAVANDEADVLCFATIVAVAVADANSTAAASAHERVAVNYILLVPTTPGSLLEGPDWLGVPTLPMGCVQ